MSMNSAGINAVQFILVPDQIRDRSDIYRANEDTQFILFRH